MVSSLDIARKALGLGAVGGGFLLAGGAELRL